MEPITAGISSLLSMFGLEGLLGGNAAATTGMTTTLAPAAGSGLGATAGGGTTGLASQMGSGMSLFAPTNAAANAVAGGNAVLSGAPAIAAATPGLLSKVGDAIMTSGVVQGAKTLLPKTSEEALATIKDKSGIGGVEKVYTTITDPTKDFRGKFDVLAPEAWKQVEKNNAEFAQLRQQNQPMQMPSYQQPYSPYQGGGIEEILKRQQGLLR